MTQTAAQRAAIAVTVNGDERLIPAGRTLGDLLREHDLDPRMVVVERNREILHEREAFNRLVLERGDVIEIVHFVGGG